MRRHRGLVGFLGLVVASVWLGGVALADVTTERSASILVFPKVIADGTRDTIIQISNTSNSVVRAHCFYVNGALSDPSQPPGPLNPPLWQEIDFDIVLTKQQPTHWTVTQGRNVNPFDSPCDRANSACTDAGFDPGLIPPVVPGFTGELKCIEVDGSGAPLSGNHLKGEATLVTLFSGDVSKYNAIGILGTENNGDGTLVLGGGQCVGVGSFTGAVCTSDAQCDDSGPCALEYNACPATWIVNHEAEGAPDLALEENGGSPSLVFTELSITPCTQNFETQEPTRVTLQFLSTDEFESQFSVSTTVDCWGNFFLRELGSPALDFQSMGGAGGGPFRVRPSIFFKTKIRRASASGSPVLIVAEEHHLAGAGFGVSFDYSLANFLIVSDDVASAASDVHHEGQGVVAIETIPGEQLAP